MEKNLLESVYRQHHEKRNRYGYLYCHGQRGAYMKQWIGQGKRVLDLGCRDGTLTSFYAQGNQVVGVDIDRKALEIARNQLNIQTCWLDLNVEWPFEPESFDVIVACEILEHLFVLEPLLQRLYDTLRPGGLFIGSVPNAFRVKNRLKFLFGREYENDPTHVRQFSWKSLHSLLSARFQSIQIIPLQGKILPFISVSPYTSMYLNKLFAKDLLWCCVK